MPFEYSPPKKITLTISFVVEMLGVALAIFGALGMIDPYLTSISIVVPAGVSIDLICEITGLIMTAIAWFIVYLGVKLRGI